ncbi:YheC/YheD family protein [Paenibacillus sacheonensis]|uniref:YheC/YheD family protein n=1 Tax=Paenibacillus sacheonensis TaxID=742054 RepID=A0A7X5C0I3_9BACL|nr:YheC/YheD family protein [Paenibacillus sacheonensis]NBC68434.1 YheC/YheD family protein [Paenibacillus sacheonensis]
MTRYVASKWRKTAALTKTRALSRYVPETQRMNKTSLFDCLKRYGMVYIKPEFGSFGNGVMRVERLESGYRFQLGKTIRTFAQYGPMYQSLVRQTGGKRYLVQKGIRLLEHDGRKFDIRVMVQLSPSRTWETTGIIGRVAAKGKIVTNYHSGGKIVSATRLLKAYSSQPESKLLALAKLGVQAGQAMQSAFPGIHVIGLDIAMDETMHPWILEVNTCPDPYIFKKHPDPGVFKKIMQYSKAYPKK